MFVFPVLMTWQIFLSVFRISFIFLKASPMSLCNIRGQIETTAMSRQRRRRFPAVILSGIKLMRIININGPRTNSWALQCQSSTILIWCLQPAALASLRRDRYGYIQACCHRPVLPITGISSSIDNNEFVWLMNLFSLCPLNLARHELH